MLPHMLVHGEIWTTKEFYVYPNEYVTWAIQIVMYPYVTGLVAGAFVLSSLYHVFGVKQLKDMARFALVFSFALLPIAMLPLQLHLQHPFRGIEVMMTPHFTSAIAAFGIVISTYGTIVALEIWFLYRKYFVETALALKANPNKSAIDGIRQRIFSVLTLGAWDISEESIHRDHKVTKILAAIGIPVACFLHGYAGFIFGSVKANALWMTPLMPVIFIMSAVVSGIALCILVYTIVMEGRKHFAKVKKRSHLHYGFQDTEHIRGVEEHEVRITTKFLIAFMILAFTLEILDLVFRGYTAMKSWDALRSVLYQRDAFKLFFLQYTVGNIVPFVMLLWPRITVRRAAIAAVFVLFGVFMMRWNVVIGGQSFSSSYHGFMDYHLPIIPTNIETFKEGVPGMIIVAVAPFILFYIYNKFIPVFLVEKEPESE